MIGIQGLETISIASTIHFAPTVWVSSNTVCTTKLYLTMTLVPLQSQGTSKFRSSITGTLTFKSNLLGRTPGELFRWNKNNSSGWLSWVKGWVEQSVGYCIGTRGTTRGMTKATTRISNLRGDGICILFLFVHQKLWFQLWKQQSSQVCGQGFQEALSFYKTSTVW